MQGKRVGTASIRGTFLNDRYWCIRVFQPYIGIVDLLWTLAPAYLTASCSGTPMQVSWTMFRRPERAEYSFQL